MACKHRFLGYHAEGSLLPDWPVAYLFIGTFNPGWDFDKGEHAPYFYGRTRNNYFWDLLPMLWGQSPLRQAPVSRWLAFLQAQRIGLTDMITSIQDADPHNPLHVRWLQDRSDSNLVRFRQLTYHTAAIKQYMAIHHAHLKGIFVTNKKAPGPIEAEIQQVAAAAQRYQLPFVRLMTPSGAARFHLPKGSKLLTGLFRAWKEAVDPLLV